MPQRDAIIENGFQFSQILVVEVSQDSAIQRLHIVPRQAGVEIRYFQFVHFVSVSMPEIRQFLLVFWFDLFDDNVLAIVFISIVEGDVSAHFRDGRRYVGNVFDLGVDCL